MNLIPTITQTLKINLGEYFSLVDSTKVEGTLNVYKFEENGLFYSLAADFSLVESAGWAESELLDDLVKGIVQISLPPFHPNFGERCFTYTLTRSNEKDAHLNQENWHITTKTADSSMGFLCFNECGVCFRTKEEAEEMLPKVYERFTKIKWRDEPLLPDEGEAIEDPDELNKEEI